MGYLSIEEAKLKMERYCAYQERSHYQVEKKLRDMGMIPEALDHIVLHLIRENFLNEERFAKAYVRGKFRQNKWGKVKIIQGLKQHRIHPKLIEKAILEIDEDEYNQTMIELIEKKRRQLKNAHLPKNQAKLANYLYQKGFRYSEFSKFL